MRHLINLMESKNARYYASRFAKALYDHNPKAPMIEDSEELKALTLKVAQQYNSPQEFIKDLMGYDDENLIDDYFEIPDDHDYMIDYVKGIVGDGNSNGKLEQVAEAAMNAAYEVMQRGVNSVEELPQVKSLIVKFLQENPN